MTLQPKALIDQVKDRINEHGNPQKITELCLDEIKQPYFTSDIVEIVEKCKNVEHLSLASCKMVSLQFFPKLSKLRYLDLQQNDLSDVNLGELQNQFQTLSGLNISKNNIGNLNGIIQCVNKLLIREINVFETLAFQANPKIIQALFENCKSLQCVNWEDRGGKQVKEFQAEFSQNSSQNQSQNNPINYSEQNSQIQQQMDEEISRQTSKKIKVQ